MSTIRKQSLISSVIVYAGFALGFVNIYLFTREGGFTKAQYGLTSIFINVASVIYAVAAFGMPAYISKFFPYYRAHLKPKENDQATWAMLIPLLGFTIALSLGILLKGPIINRVFSNAPEFIQYYYWIWPFAFGYTLFMILECFAWLYGRSILSNFFRELLFRLFITLLVVLTAAGIIKSFDGFVYGYAFTYLLLALLLFFLFLKRGEMRFTFRPSVVTRRFARKIRTMALFQWSSGIIFNLSAAFSSIVIAAVLPNGLAMAGIFTLGQTLSSLIQAPQRAVVSASVGPLSTAWREKDLGRIQRIYHQSSINQLIFAAGFFALIWLNYRDGILSFNLQQGFIASAPVFFFMGLRLVIDMGTGVSSQIILTSSWWRFEFQSGIVLLVLSLALNFLLTRQFGIIGAAASELISYSVYNAVRFYFLWRRFGLQPFTVKSLYALLLAAVAYSAAYFPFAGKTGFLWIGLRSVVFGSVFVPGVLLLKLSPDIQPVWETIRKRLGMMAKD